MSKRFVRQSSYRHVFGEAPKKDLQYTDVRPNPQGDGDCLTCSADTIAFPMAGGGGPVCLLNVDTPGRQTKVAKVSMHKGKVTDLAFAPFNSRMLATSSEDCTIKATIVDHDGIKDCKTYDTPDVTLKGHQKKVVNIIWHPTAANVLGSVSYDNTVKVWDITQQACFATVKSDKGFHNACWNSNGSLLAANGKDKMLHIFDPRTNGEGMQSAAGPKGNKAPRVFFADSIGKVVVLGFTRQSTRQYQIFDPRKFDGELAKNDVDQASGLMMSHYDGDNNIVYIAGKGDSSIKYFELTEKEPYMHYLSDFSDTSSQKGIGWAPKWSLDTTKCEIARAYRVLRDSIQPVSFCVPRKSEMFQEDIYPDTDSFEPAHDQESYKSGKDVDAKKITMDPEQREGGPKKVEVTIKKSYEELEEELAAAYKRIAELEGK